MRSPARRRQSPTTSRHVSTNLCFSPTSTHGIRNRSGTTSQSALHPHRIGGSESNTGAARSPSSATNSGIAAQLQRSVSFTAARRLQRPPRATCQIRLHPQHRNRGRPRRPQQHQCQPRQRVPVAGVSCSSASPTAP